VADLIERVRLQRFRLPLRRPLATARGAIAARTGVLIALEAASGLCGFGEASPLAGWPGEALDEAEAALAALGRAALGREPEALLAAPVPAAAPLARAGFATARLDLAARAQGVPLAQALSGGTPRASVAVNALIAADAPEQIASGAEAARAAGFSAFKLKVGGAPLARDLERVAALREAAGASAQLRLDANGAWSEAEAEAALVALARFAPEYVEEPVRGVEACARLRARSPVPLALDESAAAAGALERALRLAAADVLVLKPALLGGPRAAREVALRARGAGLAVVPTSFLDSALGVAAALQLAASLPEPGRACGLATGALFAFDLAALPVAGGALALPDGAGLGIAPEPDALARAACGPAREIRA
jgi:o-succinylbenzoate synthase